MILKQGSRETAQGLAPVIGDCENPKNTVTIRVGIPVSQSATAHGVPGKSQDLLGRGRTAE